MATQGFFTSDAGPDSFEAIQRRRALAEAMLQQGTAGKPIRSWAGGLNNLAKALIGGYQSGKAEKQEKEARERGMAQLQGLFGPVGAQPPRAPVSPSQSMTTADATARPQSQDEFVSAMMPHAMKVAQETGLDPRVVIAKSALETGWGKSAPGNNFFGIKSHGRPGGNTMPTTEVVNGQPVRVNDSFRAYGDMGESAADYAAFLRANPRYRDVLGAQGMDAQIEAIGRSGYATDPAYGQKLRQIAAGINLPQQPVQVAQAGGVPPMPAGPAPGAAPPSPGMMPGASPILPGGSFQPRQPAPAGQPPMMPPGGPTAVAGGVPAPGAMPAGPAPGQPPMQPPRPPMQPPGPPMGLQGAQPPMSGLGPPPQMPPQGQPQQPPMNAPQGGDPRRFLSIAMDASLPPDLRQMAMQMFQSAQQQGQVRPIDMGNAIGLIDTRGNVVRTIPKQSGADFGVIGEDAFGQKQYGFIDKGSRRVTPIDTGAAGQGGSPMVTTADGRQIPVPAGLDPREVRKGVSQEAAKAMVNAPETLRTTQDSLRVIRATKAHPGLRGNSIPGSAGTGLASALPDIYGTDRRAFAALHNQIQGKAFLQAFESLKGGGQITEIEGQKATQAIARMDRGQSADDYAKALEELEEVFAAAEARLMRMPGMRPAEAGPLPGQPPEPPRVRRFNPNTETIE
jgi:flagellum-specific peptidoglycan hydrolase FlgJ